MKAEIKRPLKPISESYDKSSIGEDSSFESFESFEEDEISEEEWPLGRLGPSIANFEFRRRNNGGWIGSLRVRYL